MIALYRGSGLLSRLIRLQTRSEYSHAAWVRSDGSVIEAWGCYGVRHVANPWSIHRENEIVDLWAIEGITRQQVREVERFLVSQLGKPYDWLAVLRFVTRRPQPENEDWFCSEVLMAAFWKARVAFLSAAPHLVAPGHLPWSPLMRLVQASASPEWWRAYFSRPHDGGGSEPQ